MQVFAIGIEFPLLMAMDRLQHSHLSEDHRAAIPALTPRRSKDTHTESWQIFYGDVQVGMIGGFA